MKRPIAFWLILAALTGGVLARLLPEPFSQPLLLIPFGFCIALGWVLAIRNGGLNSGWSSLFLPLKPLTVVRRSKSLAAFGISAAFAAGVYISLWLAAFAS